MHDAGIEGEGVMAVVCVVGLGVVWCGGRRVVRVVKSGVFGNMGISGCGGSLGCGD